MVEGLIGKKLGMTQIWSENGEGIPVTVVKAGPCVVVQKKTLEKDGYNAVQLGLIEEKPLRKVNKPMEGHFKKAEIPPTRILKEFAILKDPKEINIGDTIKVDIFANYEKVDCTGYTKGRGFQGVVRRHGFKGGVSSHGSMFHRRLGSIGASSFPSRVLKGQKMPGRMGGEKVTVRNLNIVKIDTENNILMIEGAIPGNNGSYCFIRKTTKIRSSKK
ncbi:MAG: 50S ribosomal protein L3 [Thermodesulfovibrionales bacterium]